MSIIYWGKEITVKKPLVFTPPYMYVLQLSNVAVEIDANPRKRSRLTTTTTTNSRTNLKASIAMKENKIHPSTASTMGSQNESKLSFEESSVRVYVETEDIESNPIKSLLCTLRYGTIDQVSVNMVFSWDSPLRLSCEHSETSPDFKVHVIGYLQPGPTPEDDDSEEDEMGMSYPITWDGNPMESDEEDDGDSYEDEEGEEDEEDGDNDEEEDDDYDDDGESRDYKDDETEFCEETNFFPPHDLLFDDDETETNDSEMEMGREYDISKDAVDPEEVEAWKKQRQETNQTAQEKSTQNKSTFEKTPLKKYGKSKNDELKREKVGKGKTKENGKTTLTKNESDEELPEEVSSSKKESKAPKLAVMDKVGKNNKKRKKRN